MLDAIKDLLNVLADILSETGNGLAQNAANVGANGDLADESGVTVFWDLLMGPLMDNVGEIVTSVGNMLNSLVDAL